MLSIVTLSMFILGYAQVPDTLWTSAFGRSDHDFGYSVQQTSDGGYIVTGLTEGLNLIYPDIYLAKIDSLGDTLWTRMYGGNLYDCGYCGQETNDGGYVFVGSQRDTHTVNLLYLIKTNQKGDHLWLKTYEGIGFSVDQTTDGGYVIAGYTWYGSYGTDVWLLKTDSLGDTLWTRSYGGSGTDEGCAIEQTRDGGYIIAGHTESYGAGGYDIYLIKTDSLGNTQWTRTYGGDQSDRAYSIQQTSDDGYVIGGYSHSFGPWTDFYLVKTDALGDTLWTRTYGGPNEDRAYCARQTSDGGYIITGQTYSSSATGYDIRVVRTDPEGDTVWTSTYGGAGWDCGRSGQQTVDGGFVFAGTIGTSGPAGYDVYLIKTEPEVGISENEIVIEEYECGTTLVSGPLPLPEGRNCRVFDISGRIVEATNIAPGVYFIEIDNEVVQKIVKIR